jgi:hypothetical protein
MAYVVSRAGDAHEALQDRLDSIANQGGRVISVTWEPRRRIIIVGRITEEQDPGYTIVWEEEEKEE